MSDRLPPFDPSDTGLMEAPWGPWELDPRQEQVRYAPHWKSHLGYAHIDELESTRTWRSRVHPDDLVPMLGALRAHLDGWTSEYHTTFRLRDARGHFRRVLSRGRVVGRDGSGGPVRMVGRMRDLSAGGHPAAPVAGPPEPVSEAPLAERLAALAEVVSDQAALLDNDLVGLLRVRGGTVCWANAAVGRMLGCRPRALVGLPVRQVFLEAAGRSVLEAARPVLPLGCRGRVQLSVARADGTSLWVDVSAGPLPVPPPGQSEDDDWLWAVTDISELKAQQARTERLALHDVLTGLPNRLLLGDRLEQGLRVADREGGVLGLCFVDLDRFKQVNDALGHGAGDTLLRVAAQRLQAGVRAHDTVARLGGDEFVLLLTRLGSEAEGEQILQRLLADLACEVTLGSHRVALSASLGVAFHPAVASADLLAVADEAMFVAKRQGGGRLQVARAAG